MEIIDQCVYKLLVTENTRHVQRGVAIVVGDVDPCAGPEEEADETVVVLVGGNVL